MAEVVTLAKPLTGQSARLPYAETPASVDILRSLHLVQGMEGGGITLISAAPGIGKTDTLLRFRRGIPKAVFHTCVAGEGSPWCLASQLMTAFEMGLPNGRDLLGSRLAISETIGCNGLLILDEAQNLIQRNPRGAPSWDTFEWIRAMSEEGCFSVVFAGDLSLTEISTKLPQLWRRMRRRVILRAVTRDDVEAYAEWRGFTGKEAIDLLFQVSRRGGALGDVCSVIDHAKLFSADGEITLRHIAAAIEDLKLGPKGGVK